MRVKIGSRKSHLAQVQAKKVNEVLKKANPFLETELYFRPSFGDLNLDVNLSTTDQKGVFTQDFLELLENGGCDMVVHSWKDLPIEENDVTQIVGSLEREDSRDLFLIKKDRLLKKEWTVLTSSPRREFNLKSFFDFLSEGEKALKFSQIRGNIPTRFEKFMKDEAADGFCVALAAVKRLKDCSGFNEEHPGLWDRLEKSCSWCILPESYCPSAAAQGALAVEALRVNKALSRVVEKINHPEVFKAVKKERAILKTYGGGCHLAIGATVVPHPLGELLFKAGHINDKSFREVLFEPSKAYPGPIELSKIWQSAKEVMAQREPLKVFIEPSKKKAFVVTKAEGFESDFVNKDFDVVYSSG